MKSSPATEFNEVRRVARELLPTHSLSVVEAEETPGESQGQLRLNREGQSLLVLITGTALTGDHGEVQGIVCFFEDVTQIIRVERMEAWREVACRIAHEIKSPLTPIQLAAERLHRRFAPQIHDHREVFDECVHSVVQEVEAIKRLVNEFSTFARLPAADHRPEDLNGLVQNLALFDTAHRDIEFIWQPDRTLPLLDLDREGIKRVLRNLLDNAVAACREAEMASQVGSKSQSVISVPWVLPVSKWRITAAASLPKSKIGCSSPTFPQRKKGQG